MKGGSFWTCALIATVLVGVPVLSDIFGHYAYRQAFDRRVLAILMVGVAVGLGWATALVTPDWLVTALVGVIVRCSRCGCCCGAARWPRVRRGWQRC